ncbi:MAG: LLM class flavin-dependent oxidoreductase [Dehalococcoidia bacterium]
MPRTGFAFPTGTAAAHIVETAKAAEAHGFESFWLTEGGGKDSISQLAFVAAHTHRIKLGTGIVTIFSRTPVMLAQTAVGMSELSGGRFVLGLGAGHEASVQRSQGQRFTRPATRMEDYIRIIKTLLREGRTSYQGQEVSVEEFRLFGAQTPVEAPVYVATLGGPLARVAGALADGVLPLMASPQGIQRLREHIEEGARAAGRDPASVDIACFIIACASSDSAAAEAEARRQVARYGSLPFYQRMLRLSGFEAEVDRFVDAQASGDQARLPDLVTDRMLEALTLTGPASRWRETIDRFRAAGVTLPIVYAAPVGPDGNASLLQAARTLTPDDLA